MRQPKVFKKMKDYYNHNYSIQLVVGLFKAPKPVNTKDSVGCGVDCRNFEMDNFHTTMEEINMSTDADTFGDSGISDDYTCKMERSPYFKIDIWEGKNLKGTIVK